VDGQISASAVTNYSGSTLSYRHIVQRGGSGVRQQGNSRRHQQLWPLTCSGGMVFNGGTNLMDISTTNSDCWRFPWLELLGRHGGAEISGALTNAFIR